MGIVTSVADHRHLPQPQLPLLPLLPLLHLPTSKRQNQQLLPQPLPQHPVEIHQSLLPPLWQPQVMRVATLRPPHRLQPLLPPVAVLPLLLRQPLPLLPVNQPMLLPQPPLPLRRQPEDLVVEVMVLVVALHLLRRLQLQHLRMVVVAVTDRTSVVRPVLLLPLLLLPDPLLLLRQPLPAEV